jgi:hypothetical protein
MQHKNCDGVDLSKLSPEEAAVVQIFRAELVREREEQTRQLRETFDHLKREIEVEIRTLQRLTELFVGRRQADDAGSRLPS